MSLSTSWTQLSATAMLAVVALMIFTGRLVPRRSLKDVQEQRDKWEQAWDRSQSTNSELLKQVAVLTEIGKTTESLLRAVNEAQRELAGNHHELEQDHQRGKRQGDGDDGDVVELRNGTT